MTLFWKRRKKTVNFDEELTEALVKYVEHTKRMLPDIVAYYNKDESADIYRSDDFIGTIRSSVVEYLYDIISQEESRRSLRHKQAVRQDVLRALKIP